MEKEYTFKIEGDTIKFTGDEFSNDIIKNTYKYVVDHPRATPEDRMDNMMSVVSKYVIPSE